MTTSRDDSLLGSAAVDVAIAALSATPAAIATAAAKIVTEKEKTKRAAIEAAHKRKR